MSYQVLARKWRPQTFADLVGQEHVVKALANALETGRLHHAYLFTGIRGVGKTTIARIFAKSLNCENGVSAEPCGNCSICQDINAGRFFDLIEVDAASNNGVDHTRELLENAQYKPTSGRFKVYLIDEVHMFSAPSFNALLKTLEEPPDHVKFLLATTEAQKLPATVLSRCLQFNLKSMPTQVLSDHLANILGQEGISFDTAALQHVARVADGSVRDSLSLIEQVAAMGEGSVTSTVVEQLIGILSPERVLELMRAVFDQDAEAALSQVAAMDDFSPEYRQLMADMQSILHQVAMQQMAPGAAQAMQRWHADHIESLAETTPPALVQLYYDLILKGQRDLQIAPYPREAFEMTLLRMIHFRPAATSGGPGAGGGSSGRSSTGAPSAVPAGSPTASPTPSHGNPPSKQTPESSLPKDSRSSLHPAAAQARTDAVSRPVSQTVSQSLPPTVSQPVSQTHSHSKLDSKSEIESEIAPGAAIEATTSDSPEKINSQGQGQGESESQGQGESEQNNKDSDAFDDSVASAAISRAEQSAEAPTNPLVGVAAARAALESAPVTFAKHATGTVTQIETASVKSKQPLPAARVAGSQSDSGDVWTDPLSEAEERAREAQNSAKSAPALSLVETAQQQDKVANSVQEPVADTDAQGSDPAGSDRANRKPAKTINHSQPSAANWVELIASMPLKGMASELAANSGYLSHDDHHLHLSISRPHNELNRPLARGQFEQALSVFFGVERSLQIECGDHQIETLAELRQRLAQEAQRAAEAAIANDPLVQQILASVDGEIEKESIYPVNRKSEKSNGTTHHSTMSDQTAEMQE